MYSSLPCSRLLVGVSGSIHAAQLTDYLLRFRREFAAEIKVIMTATATEMTSVRTVEQMVGSPVQTDLWGNDQGRAPHIRLTAWAEIFLILPATANILGKAAGGIADDLLSTAIVASPHPVVFAPAMNRAMWRSKAVMRNVATLRADGHYLVDPVKGISVTSDQLDSGLMPTPRTLLPHLWHVQMRRLRTAYWPEATAQPPRTPASAKPLPLLQIGSGPGAAGKPARTAASPPTAEAADAVTEVARP